MKYFSTAFFAYLVSIVSLSNARQDTSSEETHSIFIFAALKFTSVEWAHVGNIYLQRIRNFYELLQWHIAAKVFNKTFLDITIKIEEQIVWKLSWIEVNN